MATNQSNSSLHLATQQVSSDLSGVGDKLDFVGKEREAFMMLSHVIKEDKHGTCDTLSSLLAPSHTLSGTPVPTGEGFIPVHDFGDLLHLN